jgi:hypothetical protein
LGSNKHESTKPVAGLRQPCTYEKETVPTVFARLVPILDVACWTGIVARKVAELAFPIARLPTATVQEGGVRPLRLALNALVRGLLGG